MICFTTIGAHNHTDAENIHFQHFLVYENGCSQLMMIMVSEDLRGLYDFECHLSQSQTSVSSYKSAMPLDSM